MKPELVENRFWPKVSKTEPDACWKWQGSRQKRGYGRLNRRSYGEELAHRLAWIIVNGPIPDGLHVLHRCDNPPCCNPAHLFLGSHADNMADMAKKGRGTPGTWSKGEGTPHAKLTEQAVREIRRLYAAGGTTHRKLAVIFGVSPSTIRLLVQRRTWGHVA